MSEIEKLKAECFDLITKAEQSKMHLAQLQQAINSKMQKIRELEEKEE